MSHCKTRDLFICFASHFEAGGGANIAVGITICIARIYHISVYSPDTSTGTAWVSHLMATQLEADNGTWEEAAAGK